MAIHLLTAKQVQHASAGKTLADGDGLVLRIDEASAGWSLRYTSPTGRRREMGLRIKVDRSSVSKAQATIDAAREQAAAARELLRRGVDPIEHREASREAAQHAESVSKAERRRQTLTLARAARDYHARVIEPKRTPKHAAQWIASLENHIPAAIWHAPITSIEPPDLLRGLLSITPHERARNLKGDSLPETLRRLRQRLDSVFEDAIFHRHCASNPAAAIKRKMAEQGPEMIKGQFSALPYREAPALMARLRAAEGMAARCLEFAALTAARTGEVLFAEWCDVDMDAGIWLVPAAKMKGGMAHRVHLSKRALEILKGQHGQDPRWIFPSTLAPGKPQSNMAMLAALGRLGVRDRTTVHGLCRATFSTWANETAAARPDVVEACLAHREADRVRHAYNRAGFAQERRDLLAKWADYLAQPATNVIPLRAA
jgi:integrase